VRTCARVGEGHLYLLRRGDLWVFPAPAVNATVTVRVDGRAYVVRTLALAPRVLAIDGFVSAAEAAHLRARSGLRGACARMGWGQGPFLAAGD
jgi:hypothetical protein